MLQQQLMFILNNFPLVMCLVATLNALLSPVKFNRRLYWGMLFFTVGWSDLWEFMRYIFLLLETPHYIPQTAEQLALANLALGVSAIIASFASWSYRAAVTTTTTIYLWGSAAHNLFHALSTHHITQGGNTLWTNCLIPLILLLLLALTHTPQRNNRIYF